MTSQEQIDAELRGETVMGECSRCRLPVYRSQPRRKVGIPPGTMPKLYHSGCALATDGEFWEQQLQADCQRLRGCGYIVELRLIRPVR